MPNLGLWFWANTKTDSGPNQRNLLWPFVATCFISSSVWPSKNAVLFARATVRMCFGRVSSLLNRSLLSDHPLVIPMRTLKNIGFSWVLSMVYAKALDTGMTKYMQSFVLLVLLLHWKIHASFLVSFKIPPIHLVPNQTFLSPWDSTLMTLFISPRI